jgi:invasion protein IalB
MTVVFYKAIGEDKQLLRVVVPLGVLLPTGLGLKIDGEDVGNAPFLKCSRNGCIAEVVLQDEVVTKMKSGKQAVFIIFDTYESGIGIPVSLEGFSSGANAVK